MLPVQPKWSSATPMMMFNGQSHKAVLLSHIQSPDAAHYDSLLLVNRAGVDQPVLIITLEAETVGQPLNLVIYTERGRQLLPMKGAEPITRKNFLSAAFFVVEKTLQDRLQMPARPTAKPPLEEKPLQEFYPDAAQRQKLHYHFAHRWLPAYVWSDPARFFGYFQRKEQEPAKFIQARWQIMEQQLGLALYPTEELPTVIRRVSDFTYVGGALGALPLCGGGDARAGIHDACLFYRHSSGGHSGARQVCGAHFHARKNRDSPHGRTVVRMDHRGRHVVTHRNYGAQLVAAREPFVNAMLDKIEGPESSPIASSSFNLPITGNAQEKQVSINVGEPMAGIQCPKGFTWVPLKSSRWDCTCHHLWNTFETRGKCPSSCNLQWTETACHSCKQMSSHEAWYVGATPACVNAGPGSLKSPPFEWWPATVPAKDLARIPRSPRPRPAIPTQSSSIMAREFLFPTPVRAPHKSASQKPANSNRADTALMAMAKTTSHNIPIPFPPPIAAANR